jgi:hypothetical protein
MSYTSMVRVMVLDKMSGAEEKLDGVEQRLDQVEDVCMTNNNIQNMEMTLGVEIYKVAGNLQNTIDRWGQSMEDMLREWATEKLALVQVIQIQQQSLEALHCSVRVLMDMVGQLQEQELAQVHHVRNPIMINDVEELQLLDGETEVNTVFKDAVKVQVVTELIEIED